MTYNAIDMQVKHLMTYNVFDYYICQEGSTRACDIICVNLSSINNRVIKNRFTLKKYNLFLMKIPNNLVLINIG